MSGARLVCGFCSTGCGLTVEPASATRAATLQPTPAHPVNRGAACPKGWEALAPLSADDRATTPLLRRDRGRAEPVTWDTALDVMVERFKAIQARHGAGAVAFLSTGQIATEEMAFLGALAKFGMGMTEGDGNTRQCMATSVVAYKEAFGFDAPPYSYRDLEESDVVVLVGANPCIAHPILWERLCRNPHQPHIAVVDPRKTETAAAATSHLPLRPKSDLALFTGLAHLFIERGWCDDAFVRAHTSGLDALAAHAADFPLARVADDTGLAPAQIEALAETIHHGKRVSLWWTMGVNQSHQGVRTAQAIINLALLTGNIGRPGTGANSITGQCNAMGSRLFANTSNLLGGHDFADPAHRRKVAGILGLPEARIAHRASLAYDQIIEGIAAGKIHGLWVVGTNPAHSWINRGDLDLLLSRLDFLVVQDMYATTETARVADLVLPAAGWGEKDGTFINSERRIGRIHKVARAPQVALADFHIFRLIAERWGCADLFRRWSSPAAVFDLLAELSAGTPCDFSGLDLELLERHGGVQWPFPPGSALGDNQRRLFEDGRFFHPDGRARLLFEAPRPLPEAPRPEFPFLLLTGRGSSSQWHTQTRTSKSDVLRRLYPRELHVELSPIDARRLGIGANQWVEVRSPRGALRARAFLTHAVQPGQLFLPMHDAQTNLLTFPAFDPYSRQPSYKTSACNVTRIP